jgi:hypothetical protein
LTLACRFLGFTTTGICFFPRLHLTLIGGFGYMQALRSNGPTIRNQLKTKRDLLLKEFQKNPSKTRMAIEIKLIDETIAQLTRAFEAKNGS